MLESEIIVLKSVYGKAPGMEITIEPCKDPKTGRYPSCVRQVNSAGDMLLSEDDIKQFSDGTAVFIPVNEQIKVKNGTTFNLSDPMQKAQWECIKNSKLIAKSRDERDEKGVLLIDGAKTVVDQLNNPKGRYGTAELYIECPGKTSKLKNDIKKLIHEAQSLIFEDDLAHQIMICKLFDKNMERVNPSDITDFLLTKAEKEPQTIIKYYKSEESAVRLLIIVALERKVITKNSDGLYYGEIRLGANRELASDFLSNPKNQPLMSQIKIDTFPEFQAKAKDKPVKK